MNAKITEAYCVECGIPCERKFSDEKLAPMRADVRATYDILIDDAVKRAALLAKTQKIGLSASPNARDAVAGAEVVIARPGGSSSNSESMRALAE